MIISFTGAQSTGKSTLLNKCKEEFGDKFEYFPEITRQLKHTCKVNINENGDNLTQFLILAKHIENTLIAEATEKPCIFDRCILDGLIYTMYLHFDKNKVDELTLGLAIKIFNEYISRVNIIFYTDPKDVPLVRDGERSTDVLFRDRIINIFEWAIKEYNLKNVVRLSGSVEERMETIRETLKSKGIKL